MKSLMYHYVREDSAEFPFSAHKEKNKFIRELIFLRDRSYSFCNPSDVISHLIHQNGMRWDPKGIILTFDDGLKDHLLAARLLKDIGISKACFYIPTLPYTDKVVLAVHKAQFIRSKFGSKSLMLLEDASKALGLQLIDHKSYEGEKKSFEHRYSSQIDDQNTKEFKRLMNYYGDREIRDVLLDKIISYADLSVSFTDVYLSEDEIVEISNMGFEIGSHGCSHTPFSRLSADEQNHELLTSKRYLERLTGKDVKSFCYPYGGKSSYNSITLEALKHLGYENAISVDPRDITPEDLEINPFEIPRFDCNMIDSLFSFSE